MKQLMLSLLFGGIIFPSFHPLQAETPRQSATPDRPALAQSALTPLQKAVARLDSARTPAEWQQVRAQFERLSSVDASSWLPTYYLAFTDIELFFRTSGGEERAGYLEEAAACLDRLKEMKVKDPAERSEIATLRGYEYYARVAADPAQNGPKYAALILSSFGEALRLNPDNPRALLLNASFQKHMAAAMRQTYEPYNDERSRAAALLERPVSPAEFPHWGKQQMAY